MTVYSFGPDPSMRDMMTASRDKFEQHYGPLRPVPRQEVKPLPDLHGLTPDDLEWFLDHGWDGYLPTLLGKEIAYLCSRCHRIYTYGREPDRVCLPCQYDRRTLISVIVIVVSSTAAFVALILGFVLGWF